MDDWAINEIHDSLDTVGTIIASDIFQEENLHHPWRHAAMIMLFVFLRDLMSKAETYSQRVSFTDDIVITAKVKDVTGAITFFRDALCHLNSPKSFLLPKAPVWKLRAITILYEKGRGVAIPGYPPGTMFPHSDYEDDICFICGEQKLYLKRHIIRAYEEAKDKLQPFIAPYFHNSE